MIVGKIAIVTLVDWPYLLNMIISLKILVSNEEAGNWAIVMAQPIRGQWDRSRPGGGKIYA